MDSIITATSPTAPVRRARTAATLKALFDRGKVAATIASLAETHEGDTTALRKAAVECFRTALDEGRALARTWLDTDRQGMACAENISHIEDELIRAIYDFVVTHLYPANNPSAAEHLAVAAVGGYGRGTLAPGSDIDLLFVLPSKQTPWGESVVEAILYVLWDLRQKVGHATRSVDECIRQASSDMTIRTAMLEARLILGDEKLFGDMRSRFQKEIVSQGTRDFVAAKLSERDGRVNKAGVSRYLVEPNVKESKGGLRDLNTLFWIAKYVYRVDRVEDLVNAGLFSRREANLFKRCDSFLWGVRCHMHYLTGRGEDRLSFDIQRQIAQKLGYVSHGGLSAVERFMKHYFLVAKDVGDLTAIVCAAMEEREAKPRAALNRFMDKLRPKKRALSGGDFAIEFDRITVAKLDVFTRDPVNLIRLYWLADKNGLAIHPDATRLVTQSLKHITAAVRADAEANKLFVDIVTSHNSPETVLRVMNESGVLGRFVPEFGRIVAMMQFNMYHHYTVDEHLLRTVGVLSGIESGRLKEEHPLCAEILPHIVNRRALYVALFLHDVAKGRKEDHSIAGAAVARKVCPRLGLTEAETDTVAWLIEVHLEMSTIAQSRDLSDPRTIQKFANIVQSIERLRMLLILTVCDIRAVGPGVWNGWKGQLLRTLYWETEIIVAGGHSTIDRQARVARAQDELQKALPDVPQPEFEAYATRHYPAYWLKVDLPHKVTHAQLLRQADAEARSLTTQVATDAFRGITELTVIAPDHPRLLSIIAGACAAAGSNIVDAQIFTTTDGLALDTIFMSRGFERDDDELRRATRIATSVEKALRGELHIGDLVAAKGAQGKERDKPFVVAPDVIVDNGLSNRYTVLEVSGLDRPGLLFELTSGISKLNLNIGSAHVATFGEKAVDVFYVTDLTGAKITNPTRQGTIRQQLLDCFNAADSGRVGAKRSKLEGAPA